MDLIAQSLNDCKDDCEEVHYLLLDVIRKLSSFKKYCTNMHQVDYFTGLYTQNINTVLSLQDTLAHSPPSEDLLHSAGNTLSEIRDFLRINQGQIGTLLTSSDWQSPSFAGSTVQQAGRQTGTILPSVNDYKRDRHDDAFRYERKFIKEYVDHWIKFPIYAYATGSGMAAFTTILNYLMLEHKAESHVLAGESIWFENKMLLAAAFQKRFISVKESDTKTILAIIKDKKPSVIVFDSVPNSADMHTPDLDSIIPYIVKMATTETYIIVDNTCGSIAFQPLKYVYGKNTNVRLIVFESLNKYHQFGMDRVTAGIIWCYGRETMKLSDYRAHMGTNIMDAVAASLPTPNRTLLHKKLMRHMRNAQSISSQLRSWLDLHPECPIQSIEYPKNPQGGIFTITWKGSHQSVSVYTNFLTRILRTARSQGVSIIGGTSFGLDTTRIYVAAQKSGPIPPFLRVAAGTENRIQVEHIVSVFLTVFKLL